MEEEKTTSFFRFEDLRIYDKALVYAEWVYSVIQTIPETSTNKFLAKDFQRLAYGIPSEIAEGSSRSKPQFVQMLKEAKSTARSCLVMGSLLMRIGLINEEQNNKNREMIIEMSRMLGALINSLEKPNRRQETRNSYEDENLE